MTKDHLRPKRHSGLEALRHHPGACSCQKLRSASRAVTKMYDEHLQPAGLTISQYSVLAALYYVSAMPLRKLANKLELDRTTLTRSLARLEQQGFISATIDATDSRIRSIAITDAGLQKLIDCYPLWSRAQEQLALALGPRGLGDLRKSLDKSIGAMKV
ncbi:MarR family winged helix-turn-helix transcriptional regulator [Bradyrhizobium australafricanum]|uniref:MarR family winged helix-turn-helix transcriptional regulator n=1 Tax=Bradyrhizobium australafricanum TaxID=2821406 RepID=UPI001CE2791A|nr:MarR family transcriptional regulator [Bradyrhizobium australafricanum]MCA6098402.1 MarR family transcriptional regulator [Bradyrhizobium australafricanum]